MLESHRTDHKKIAVIVPFPLKGLTSATEEDWASIAEMLRDRFEIEFFCLSNRNFSNAHFMGHRLHEINESLPRWSISDLTTLALLGYRPSLNKDYPILRERLDEYAPDYIITGEIVIYKFIKDYMDKHKGIKLILITDSPEGIEKFNIKILDYMGYGFIKPFVSKNYTKLHMRLYENMLGMSHSVITNSEYYKEKIQKRYPKYSRKINGVTYRFLKKLPKLVVRKEINKILFMGDYLNTSNREAIENIELIASHVPDKIFIIAGRNTPKMKNGNVIYYGELTKAGKEKLYNEIDLCIAPIITGSGLKAKMIDYFFHNKLTLGTSIAFAGVLGAVNGKNAIIEDDIKRYPDRISELDKDPAKFMRMQRDLYLIIKHYSKEEIKKSFNRAVR